MLFMILMDLACDTFLKIAQKYKRKFVIVQLGESEPFISKLLTSLPTTIADLEPHQIHSFYESVSNMIQAESDPQKRDEYLKRLMELPNQKWVEIIGQARHSVDFLKDPDVIRTVRNILQMLNASKNKLKSMDEVRSLLSLRALILNDNEIVSICRLDQLKELNTLVLSRNPINKLGESLVEVKSNTKLSLSNCQLQAIDSLKSCTELKELQLAHNDTKMQSFLSS